MIAIAISTAACAPPAKPAAQPVPVEPEPVLSKQAARAVDIVRRSYGNDRAALHASFGEGFRQAVPVEKFTALTEAIEVELGRFREARFLDARSGPVEELHVAAFFDKGALLYVVSLDAEGILQGLLVRPFVDKETPNGPADGYVAKHTFRPPFEGTWLVGRGGHTGNVHQWYAFDLLVRGEDGKTHSGDGKENEDYLAWGKFVVAPADGVIVTVVNGVPDHGIDHTDRYFVPGNLVVIDHGEGEHSFLCHFQQGSIVVKPGDTVTAGTRLGLVGNSGNSSEPHIHWHVGTHADVSRGHGLPIRFVPLVINGERIESPQPRQGDLIEAP